LKGFFEKHPEYKNSKLFLAGESYAGKYLPSLANKLLDEKFPFEGMLLGNALVHPIFQRLIKPDQVYNSGLIDYKQRQKMLIIEKDCVSHIQQGFTNERDSPCHKLEEYFKIASGGINFYDIRTYEPSYNRPVVQSYMNRKDVQENVHLKKDVSFIGCSPTVYSHLKNEVLKSSRSQISRGFDFFLNFKC
jgi:carboxypeptidase C (cathepsin A)